MADRISPQDVRARQDAGADPVVIDVRDPDQYAAGHVAGALSIPIAELPEKLAELGRDHQIITYCNGGTRCERAATLLRENGFDAQALGGGYPGWKAAGLPVEEPSEG
jgi:rhodanese-related sulfurtransferase